MAIRSAIGNSRLAGPRNGRRRVPPSFVRFLRHRVAVLSAGIIGVFFLAAAFAPLIAPYDPLEMSIGPRLSAPAPGRWLGTDEFGRDILSRIAYGAQIAFTVGFSAACASAVLGSVIGLVGGYFGGLLDRVVTMVIDLALAFPTILLAIALTVVLGPRIETVILAITIVQCPHFARVIRGATLAAKKQAYVESARAVGADNLRILLIHILPNVLAPVVIQLALSFSYAILMESSLSFLGVGNPPPAPSWGSMLSGAYGYIERAPWAAIFPGTAITLLILAFNLMGDGLRDLLDPTRR